jgi:hypothetical protein
MNGTVDDGEVSFVVTSRDTVTERTCSSTVPEIVTMLVPCGVESDVLTVRMEAPFPSVGVCCHFCNSPSGVDVLLHRVELTLRERF